MASTVAEVMNDDLFAVRPAEAASTALDYLLRIGIHAAPVLDDAGRPVGMIAISDLVGALEDLLVEERMSTPAITVPRDAPVEEAANRLADTGYHHLAVVDGAGRAVGFLSAIDVIRAHLRRRILHPDVSDGGPVPRWSETAWLTSEQLASAPAGGGVLTLIARGKDTPDTVVWAESAENLRARLQQLLDDPPDRLLWYLEGGPLAFRTAPAPTGSGHRWAFGSLVGRLEPSSS